MPAITDFRAKGTIIGPMDLTAVFGMGTGVTPSVWSPTKRQAAVFRTAWHVFGACEFVFRSRFVGTVDRQNLLNASVMRRHDSRLSIRNSRLEVTYGSLGVQPGSISIHACQANCLILA